MIECLVCGAPAQVRSIRYRSPTPIYGAGGRLSDYVETSDEPTAIIDLVCRQGCEVQVGTYNRRFIERCANKGARDLDERSFGMPWREPPAPKLEPKRIEGPLPEWPDGEGEK